MIWLLTLSLAATHDGGRPISPDTRTLVDVTYRVRIVGDGAVRDYVRPVKDASVLDAMASLPADLVPKLSKARICVFRGANLMEVDWRGIVCNGATKTNWVLCEGDTILVVLP
jgi:hypothetical protein